MIRKTHNKTKIRNLALVFASFALFAIALSGFISSHPALAKTVPAGCYKQVSASPLTFKHTVCPDLSSGATFADSKHITGVSSPSAGVCYTKVGGSGPEHWSAYAAAGSNNDDSCTLIAHSVVKAPSGGASAKTKSKSKSSSKKSKKSSLPAAKCYEMDITASKNKTKALPTIEIGCPKTSRIKPGECYLVDPATKSPAKIGCKDAKTRVGSGKQVACSDSVACKAKKAADQKAAKGSDNSDPTCSDPSKADDANCSITKQIIIPVVNILSMAVGLVVVLSIIIAGIMYITANGNPQQVETAKKRISNSILALVVYIFGFALLQWLIPGGIFNK